MKPLVSVIVPCHNAEGTIADTLHSILAADLPHGMLEVIAVDDASQDNTSAILNTFSDKVQIYRLENNKGTCVARNTGIRLSKGDFIAFCDHDDLWEPSKLRKQLPLFDNPKVCLVVSDADRFDEKGVICDSLASERPLHRGKVLRELLENNFVVLSSAVVRRKTLEEVGYFNEAIFPGEDIDLWLRIAVKWKVDYVPEILAHHRQSSRMFSRNHEQMFKARLPIIAAMSFAHFGVIEARKIVAATHFKHGLFYLWQHDLKEARREFFSSVRLWPYQLRYWCYLLSTFHDSIVNMGVGVKAMLRKRKAGSSISCNFFKQNGGDV